MSIYFFLIEENVEGGKKKRSEEEEAQGGRRVIRRKRRWRSGMKGRDSADFESSESIQGLERSESILTRISG